MADPNTTSAIQLERYAQLDPEHLAAAEAVLDAAARADGVAPVSEQGRLRLRYGGPHALTVLARDSAGEVIGVGQLDTADDGATGAELAVHPAYRRHGVGRALADELRLHARGDLLVWAHGDLPGAVALAGRLGYERARVLWRLRRPLGTDIPDRRVSDRFVVRTFVPGQDEEAWLRVNSRAFAHHPEQGALMIDDLRQREGEDWFDPDGFFLAEYADPADSPGELAGFHWTKVHPNGDGEIYVLGVDPSTQGTGLGAALAVVGLRHLRDRGLTNVLLYVDEDNTAAMSLYERLGFERDSADAQYRLRHG